VKKWKEDLSPRQHSVNGGDVLSKDASSLVVQIISNVALERQLTAQSQGSRTYTGWTKKTATRSHGLNRQPIFKILSHEDSLVNCAVKWLFKNPTTQNCCCSPAGRRYRSTAARVAGECGQCHVVSVSSTGTHLLVPSLWFVFLCMLNWMHISHFAHNCSHGSAVFYNKRNGMGYLVEHWSTFALCDQWLGSPINDVSVYLETRATTKRQLDSAEWRLLLATIDVRVDLATIRSRRRRRPPQLIPTHTHRRWFNGHSTSNVKQGWTFETDTQTNILALRPAETEIMASSSKSVENWGLKTKPRHLGPDLGLQSILR